MVILGLSGMSGTPAANPGRRRTHMLMGVLLASLGLAAGGWDSGHDGPPLARAAVDPGAGRVCAGTGNDEGQHRPGPLSAG